MQLPAFLTGSPGRAAYDLTRVRAFGDAASTALHAVVDGSMSGAEATAAMHQADGALLHGTWDDLVFASGAGLRRALGPQGLPTSMLLQSSIGELSPVRTFLSNGATASMHAASARQGAAAADALVGAIDGAMPSLESAARRTAATRITLGALGVGGSIAGLHALGDR